MSDIENDTPLPTHLRFENYTGSQCWQRQIRTRNLSRDIAKSPLSLEKIRSLRTGDFNFSFVPKEDKEQCDEVKKFIEENEWLGKINQRVTHRFIARTKISDELVGVIIMSVPNTFSLLLGGEYRNREKLISRGASLSWSPKNTASWLLMNSIHWMVRETDFCLFTAYSDSEAKELGTIYQSCNFFYLGKTSGTDKQYFDPQRKEAGWFSSRHFRHKSVVKRHAKELGIELPREWWKDNDYSLDWTKVPTDIKVALKGAEKRYQAACLERPTPRKHKYCYVLGKKPLETKFLRKRFKELHPDLVDLPYPKNRGE